MKDALKTHLEEFFKKYDQNEAYVVDGTRVFTDAGLARQFMGRNGISKDKFEVITRHELTGAKAPEPTKEEKAATAKMQELTAQYKEVTGKDVPATWTAEDIEAELALVPELEALKVDIKAEIGELDLVALLAKKTGDKPTTKEPTVAELKAKLKELGVEFPAKAKLDELKGLLADWETAEAEKKAKAEQDTKEAEEKANAEQAAKEAEEKAAQDAAAGSSTSQGGQAGSD